MLRNVTCKTVPVQRSRGHSAVGGAAYRAGVNLKARGLGENGGDKWFRYSPKAVVVRETFIMSPEGVSDWVHDRGELWNQIEEMETNKKARLGRDVTLGLAYELDHDEQRALVKEFAQGEFVDKGFVVDISIHNYGRTIPAAGASEANAERIREWAAADIPFLEKDDATGQSDVHVMIMRNRDGNATGYKLYQPHAHVRVTPRPWDEEGFAQDKYAAREFNKHDVAMKWRYEWPKLQNAYLERAGSEVRVTSTAEHEDQFPDLQLLPKRSRPETYTLEQRADQLDEEQRQNLAESREVQDAEEDFRDIHNDSIVDGYRELEDEEGSQSEEGEKTRVALWWHQTAARFNQWRFEFAQKAEEWSDRFGHHAHRIRKVIGWHDVDREAPDIQVRGVNDEGQVQDRGPQEQEP